MFAVNRGRVSEKTDCPGMRGNDRLRFDLGHVECASLLLSSSAQIDRGDNWSRTALMFASVNTIWK